jgi:hypothetical protein
VHTIIPNHASHPGSPHWRAPVASAAGATHGVQDGRDRLAARARTHPAWPRTTTLHRAKDVGPSTVAPSPMPGPSRSRSDADPVPHDRCRRSAAGTTEVCVPSPMPTHPGAHRLDAGTGPAGRSSRPTSHGSGPRVTREPSPRHRRCYAPNLSDAGWNRAAVDPVGRGQAGPVPAFATLGAAHDAQPSSLGEIVRRRHHTG